jgi:hypothetical protein
MTTHDGEVMPSDELDGGRFWTIGEIDNAIGKGVLTPNFELEYRMLRQLPGFPPTNDKKS